MLSVEISLESLRALRIFASTNNLLLRKNTGTGKNSAKYLRHEVSEADTKVNLVSEHQLCKISIPFCRGFHTSDVTAVSLEFWCQDQPSLCIISGKVRPWDPMLSQFFTYRVV